VQGGTDAADPGGKGLGINVEALPRTNEPPDGNPLASGWDTELQLPAEGTWIPLAPTRKGYALAKRLTDVALALLGLILLLPVWMAVSLLIVATSPGPVIFRQTRVGLGGKFFTCYKFRSMVHDAERRRNHLLPHNEKSGALFKIHDDPRTTRLGVWLRKYSVDEFPQLVNVVRGEMSLVGPRPLPAADVDFNDPDQRSRLAVKPGITGLWQVSGRANLGHEDLVLHDLAYIHRRSYWLDWTLIFKTIPAVITGKGAC
jgi:lipopolysaccharide/colanic/teichoic acid biosynthesis glycosyltransferase